MTDDRIRHPLFELAPHDPDGQLPAPATQQLPPVHDDEEEGGSVDVRRYIGAVLRQKWWVLALLVVGTVGGYFASQRVPLEYVAQTTIWIEQSSGARGAVDVGPIQSSQLLSSTAWIDLLRSFMVLDPVVITEQLYLHPERKEDEGLLSDLGLQQRFAPGSYRIRVQPQARQYTLETSDGILVERGSFGDSVGASTLGLAWQPELSRFPADRAVGFRVASPRDEALKLGRGLRTQIDKTGGFLRVELNGEDPEKTASILNSLAERHVEVAAELKREKLDTLVSILEEQLVAAERGLKSAEIALEEFKVATVTLPSERSTPVTPGLAMTRDPAFDNFFNMQVELEQIRRDQDALERAIGSEQGVSVEALSSVGAVQEAPDLQQALTQLTGMRAQLRALRSRYTGEHRAVATAAADVARLERETIPAMVNTLLAELRIRESQLEGNIASASGELREIPTRAIEEARLQRQVVIQGELYTRLEQRFQEARLAAASSIPDIRILDEAAVPQQPVSDQKYMVLLMGMMAGLGLGLGGAILRDRLDARIRYPSEITRGLGLSILGAVPTLRKGRTQKDHLTQVLEAFRSIRLNVTHAFGAAGPLTITITSPGPGDGKSFVASNLALSFADQGHRTCLVDGDTRRGALHRLLDSDRKPGLTDLLGGHVSFETAVRTTRFKGLDMIPSGTRVRHGPELLGSVEMRELLARLKGAYDVVIIDSPPLGAGVDPFALGTLTSNLLLVLRSGTTNRELAESKLELVERLPIRILGAVMNGLPQGRQYGYGHYAYSYIPGYAASNEEQTETMRQPLQVGGEAQG